MKADRSAAGEDERHITTGLVMRLEAQRQQLQHGAFRVLVHALKLCAQHPVEMQGAAAALKALLFFARDFPLSSALPVKAVGDHRKALVGRHERNVFDPQHRILEMSGHDLQVLLIQRQ